VLDQELDVRGLRKPDKHPTIFASYDRIDVGDAIVVINNHDPKHLRDEFELEHPGGYGWEYLDSEADLWRIRISKRASTSLPRLLCHTATVGAPSEASVAGAVWRLPMATRDLDSNVIQLPAGAAIDGHAGPDNDVLIHVIDGDGQLTTELGTVDLTPGALIWLPRRSRRQFTAGASGLRYLTVHQRRKSLALQLAPTR
jgi:uncharacterized protein (DUF2249 family)/quercetin dioxygenase-like cupin family protein